MITLKTLPLVSEQAVFDFVARHLLTQNAKSRDARGCAYKGKEGMQCAAGCLIGPDEYRSVWENGSWNGLVESGYVPGNHCDLIQRLQRIHDDSDPDEWRENLMYLAEEKSLMLDTEIFTKE